MSQLQKEKELIEKKMQRIEKSKEAETKELRDKLELAQGDVRVQLRAKDDKINEVAGASVWGQLSAKVDESNEVFGGKCEGGAAMGQGWQGQ